MNCIPRQYRSVILNLLLFSFVHRSHGWYRCNDYRTHARIIVPVLVVLCLGLLIKQRWHRWFYPDIIAAIEDHNKHAVMAYLKGGCNINLCERSLRRACQKKNIYIVQLLLRFGTDINAKGSHSQTPLHIACQKKNIDIVRLLLRSGADINAKGSSYNCTPLHIACQKKNIYIVELLLIFGADINAKDDINNTPLHIACQENNIDIDIVKLLLETGADINAKGGYNKKTPLHIVCEYGSIDIVKLLLQAGADINAKGSYDNCIPLHIACEHNSIDIVKLLLNSGADINAKGGSYNNTPLHIACQNNSIDMVKLLLQTGADVNAEDGYYNNTPLHRACGKNNIDINIVKLLLQTGADINAKGDSYNCTPLHIACEHNSIDIVKLLLNSGAEVIYSTINGKTPLLLAVERSMDIFEVIYDHIVLKKAYASLKHTSENNQTFFYCMYNVLGSGACSQFLKKYRQKTSFLDQQLYYATSIYQDTGLDNFIQICIEEGGDLNQRHGQKQLRPVDVACIRYCDAPEVIIREQIYHIFLKNTPCLLDERVGMLLSSRLDKDCVRHIMSYYYAATIDQKIIKDRTYDYNWTNYKKQHYKNQLLKTQLEKIGYNAPGILINN